MLNISILPLDVPQNGEFPAVDLFFYFGEKSFRLAVISGVRIIVPHFLASLRRRLRENDAASVNGLMLF